MQTADLDRFGALLEGVFELYGRSLTPFVVQVWWEALRGYELPAVQRGFSLHVASPDQGQYAPRPADVIRMMEGTSQDAAQLAWVKVMRAVGCVGQYRSLVFDDAVIHRVVDDLGGWPALCQLPEAELPFFQRRFEAAYRLQRQRCSAGLPLAHPPYLPGVAEQMNKAHGFAPEPPVLVGAPEQAQAVLRSGSPLPRLPVQVAGLGQQALGSVAVGGGAAVG